MGQLDRESENPGAVDIKAAEVLKVMTAELENLRRDILTRLDQDVKRLEAEKSHLIEDINQLQTQRQQQVQQQQQLVRQLAPALANQLQEVLRQRLTQLSSPTRSPSAVAPPVDESNEAAYRLISSLDSTLRTTFNTLQQDLSSYQSSLSRQLSEMHSLEQQGEAILETLVSRLREQLQAEAIAPPTNHQIVSPPTYEPYTDSDWLRHAEGDRTSEPIPPVPILPEPEPPASLSKRPAKPQKLSKIQLGFVLVLISSLALSFFNVVIKIILKQRPIFGAFDLGGFIAPGLGNSLLILWLRMLVVVPLMTVLATFLYPKVFKDIKEFSRLKDKPLAINVFASGFFLFLSQILIYIALGELPTGVAITIFFIYPIVTGVLAWILFRDRPTLFRNLITLLVLLGVALISIPVNGNVKFSLLGVGAGAGAGITFAIYVILTQACAKKLHPVPFSLINFFIILACSGLSLMIPLPESFAVKINPDLWPQLIASGLVLGGLTLVSYLLNNIGISYIGAAPASILGATGPVLTSLIAFSVIGESLTTQQLFGMFIVTAGVVALSIERLQTQKKAAKAAR